MFVVMGGTGHVGGAVARALRSRGEKVTIIARDAARADEWRGRGVEVVAADVNDVASLRAAFQRGKRAFLLNPPADPQQDTDVVERRTIANILRALEGSGLQKVIAASAGGVGPGERVGDLSTLWHLEEGLRVQPIPAAINRGGYYMSNWDFVIEVAHTTGILPTMFPEDFELAMVAPEDVGEAAATRLMSSIDDIEIRYIVGPKPYTSRDVARALSVALAREVTCEVTPPDALRPAYKELGFSDAAADAYARMTEKVLGGIAVPSDALRGTTTLESYINEAVRRYREAR